MDRVYVMQLVRSFQTGGLSRRKFLKQATLALGSVASANALLAACTPGSTDVPPVVEPTAGAGSLEPASDTASETPEATPGVAAETIEFAGPQGTTLTGYLARPTGGAAVPAVVLIQEWWGLNDHIKDVTRRLAAEGFVVLAPDLYNGVVVTEPDEARKLVMELDMESAVSEIRAAIDHLQTLDTVSGSKVAVMGFCMGGRLSLQTAIVEDDLYAVVPYYGTPLTADQAPEVAAPLLGIYGEEDGGIPVSEVEAMGAALKEAGVTHEIHIYPGAQHAFFNDTREAYNAEAAADAWQRTLSWLRTHQE